MGNTASDWRFCPTFLKYLSSAYKPDLATISFFSLSLENNDILLPENIYIFCNLFWPISIYVSISKFTADPIITVNKQMKKG